MTCPTYVVGPCATGCVLHVLSLLVPHDMSYMLSVLVPQDVSYMCCVELRGPQSDIVSTLGQMSSPQVGECSVTVSDSFLANVLFFQLFVTDLFQHVYLCAKSFCIDKLLSAVLHVHATVSLALYCVVNNICNTIA